MKGSRPMRNIFFSSNWNIAMTLLVILYVLFKIFNNVSILKKRENGKRLIIGRLILSGLILINFVYVTPCTFLLLSVLFLLDTLFSRFAEEIFSESIYISIMIQITIVLRIIISEASGNSYHIMGFMLFSINLFLLLGLLLEVNKRNKEKEKATIIERTGFQEDEGEDKGEEKQGGMSGEV